MYQSTRIGQGSIDWTPWTAGNADVVDTI